MQSRSSVRGLTNIADHKFLTSTKYFQSAAAPADGILIPNLHKALLVASNSKMTPRSIISILTFSIFSTTSFVACGQVSNKNSTDKNPITKSNGLRFDTSKTAIIEFNKKRRWPFDSTFKAATLTQNELQLVDSLLLACVANYNKSLDKKHKQWSIDLKNRNYRKQLIVVTNKSGQKEVWVNCFCTVDNDRWKTRIFSVDDGGNCYFNFKLNLATKKYYDLGVNGVA